MSDVDGRALRHTGADDGPHDNDGTPRVTIRMPEPLLEALERAVETDGYMDRSEAIREAVRHHLLDDDRRRRGR